ncbi:MAG: LLM class flavin-dependent oxidoreductase [Chloroflexota bacterium]
MEIGITTFAETTTDPATGRRFDAARRLTDLLEEVKLADQVGLDVYAVGEHHRPDFAAPSPAVILGAAAAVTERIRLGSAVTVLSTDDPVRVFEDFTTVDLISNGRAEIWAGRGSFTETYPLFGYSLDDYDQLFADKLDLLLKLRENERVTWSGLGRPAMNDLGVYPRPVQQPLPVWVGVGGNPNSVIRAGRLGLPLVIAIIGGEPRRFAPLVELYRESGKAAGHDPSTLKVAINSQGFIADDANAAVETFYPPYAEAMSAIGRERGWSAITRGQFEALRSPIGSLLLGSPGDVIEKMLCEYELFGYDRFLLHLSVGTMPHDKVMRAIELLGTKVAPEVRQAIDARKPAVVSAS